MKAIYKCTILAAISLVAGLPRVSSQVNIPRFQFGLNIGGLVYQGDLTPEALGSYKTIRPMLQLSASKIASSSFSLRANLVIGSLAGNDSRYDQPEYRQQRNFNFHTPLLEISGMAEWNLLNRNYDSRGLAPYVFAGLGYGFLDIQRDWSRLNTAYFPAESELIKGLAVDAQHGVPKGIPFIPVGAGLRYFFSDKFGVSAETSYRIFSNDYLDGFSQAANPEKTDHYYSHSVGIVYRVGKKNTLACPVIRY